MKEEGPGSHPGAQHHQKTTDSEHRHGADDCHFSGAGGQDGSDDRIHAVELTRRLGSTAGEYISLSSKRPGDAPRRYRVVGDGPHRLANHVAMAGAGVNHYFLINPVRPDTAKRGRADEVTRLADLAVEVDGYKNGHASVETVWVSPSSCRRGSARPRWGSSSPVAAGTSTGRWPGRDRRGLPRHGGQRTAAGLAGVGPAGSPRAVVTCTAARSSASGSLSAIRACSRWVRLDNCAGATTAKRRWRGDHPPEG